MKKYRIIIGIFVCCALGAWFVNRFLHRDLPSADEAGNYAEEMEEQGNAFPPADSQAKAIADCYRSIYEGAEKKDKAVSLETRQKIVTCLGNAGYTVVDSENQIDMANAQPVRDFCADVAEKRSAEVMFLAVKPSGGFIRYQLTADDGKVNIVEQYHYWNDRDQPADKLEIVPGEQLDYPADTWNYTEKGYLFFSEYRQPNYDDFSGHTAIRVEPLDPVCRELTRKYMPPTGYWGCNMFLENWDESDYGKMDFSDIYEPMYQMHFQKARPYGFNFVGETFWVPAAEYEDIFLTYFPMDVQTLRKYAVYDAAADAYRYRPRGMFDKMPTPEIPYPEVTAYEETEDGRLLLTVDAVWKEQDQDRAYQHILEIRPLADGGFQYLSNQVVPSEENVEVTWYRPRLTDAQWDEYYRIPE